MKVIGGPCDGINVWVNEKIGAINLMSMTDHGPAGFSAEYALYTVRRISHWSETHGSETHGSETHGSEKWDFSFLAPSEWTDRQAFDHQFGK